MDTEQIEEVYEALKNIKKLTKLLKTGEEFTLITEGAFVGFEEMLIKVDRHNRNGVMEIDMFGKKTEMRFGL